MNTPLARQLSLAVCLCGIAVGCERPGPASAPMDVARPMRRLVEQLALEVDAPIRQRVEARAARDVLAARLKRHARVPWRQRLSGGIKYADLLQRVYKKNKHHAILTSPAGLTPRGESVLAVLNASEAHALKPDDYHVKRIPKLSKQLASLKLPAWKPVTLKPDEIEALISWARAQGLDPDKPATREVLLDALVGDLPDPSSASPTLTSSGVGSPARRAGGKGDEGEDDRGDEGGEGGEGGKDEKLNRRPAPPVPRLVKLVKAHEAAMVPALKAQVNLELRIVDGALRLARDLGLFNVRRLTWKDLKDAGGSKNIIYARLEDFLTSKLATARPAEVAARFEGLWPRHPQYRALVAERARYKKIASNKGWPEVKPFKLTASSAGASVRALRRRLEIEGYLKPASGDAAQRAGADLTAAIARYRQTHQLKPGGPPSPSFWRSLNVPAARRLAQIELAMLRWRESYYEGEQDFLFVNLPDFHAELWHKGARRYRFRVVIGKDNRVCNPETQRWEYPNATPEQMSAMEYFILNPSWYVPARIVEQELKPKMERDPEWLKNSDYEIVKRRGDHLTMRQKPGDENALGRVKFIFPSPHNTYLHDTPRKKYFDYTIRAYSHGCMRVHNPLKLAEQLVEVDGQKGQVDVDGLVKAGQTKMVKLKRHLPVFIEYYTVWADDEGRATFLIDIYDRDARRTASDPAAFDRCDAPRAEHDGGDEGAPDTSADIGP